MKRNAIRNKISYFLPLIILAAFFSGCCCRVDNNPDRKDPVIAVVNNYELTVSDFNNEARSLAPDIRRSADPGKAKADALDEVITKKVLLQEAQTRNFDKDAKFMKEIELYWEQALLKLLLRNKIDELSKKAPPGMSGSAKQDMLQAELTKWIAGLRSAAKVKIYKDNLDKADIK